MQPKRRRLIRFFAVNAALLLFAWLYPFLTLKVAIRLPLLSGCLLHDLFHLYCPLCGGTRALSALTRLDFAGAFRYNPLAVVIAVLALVTDAVILIRILRGRERLFRLPTGLWVAGLVVLIAFGVLRNVLLIVSGVDPLGDLNAYWHG